MTFTQVYWPAWQGRHDPLAAHARSAVGPILQHALGDGRQVGLALAIVAAGAWLLRYARRHSPADAHHAVDASGVAAPHPPRG